MDLASARNVQLVPVDDKTMAELRSGNCGYTKVTIKAGTYPKQDKDVPAIGYMTHIVAACDLPEDVVYKMTKAMATGVNDMAAVVKPIAGLTAKDMASDICVLPIRALPTLQGSGRNVAVGIPSASGAAQGCPVSRPAACARRDGLPGEATDVTALTAPAVVPEEARPTPTSRYLRWP
jgi:hypothetical protein